MLDVDIAGERVFPVAAVLAERDIPFLFVTGGNRADVAAEFHDRPLLSKPFRGDQLLAMVTMLVAPPLRCA